MHNPLAILAGVFDRLGHHEQAATISGFAASPMALASYPQLEATVAHLREILGDDVYESFAQAGETMTIAAMANYALANIERARNRLAHVTFVGRKAVSLVPKRIPVASLPISVSAVTASNTGTIVAASANG